MNHTKSKIVIIVFIGVILCTMVVSAYLLNQTLQSNTFAYPKMECKDNDYYWLHATAGDSSSKCKCFKMALKKKKTGKCVWVHVKDSCKKKKCIEAPVEEGCENPCGSANTSTGEGGAEEDISQNENITPIVENTPSADGGE